MSTLAICGRPNVGKSTLFNRITGSRKAIVEDFPGVTRDRNMAVAEYHDTRFILIDTGGFEPEADETLKKEIARQVIFAAEEADVLIFVVDAKEGLNPVDQDIARRLMATGKPIVLAVNKADNAERESYAAEFWALGIDPLIPISAEHNSGIGELLEAALARCPNENIDEQKRGLAVAVIGRPNVGKSSLVNRLLGEERVIVSDIAGTTRDAIDTPLIYNGQQFTLIDTAGIRRKGKVGVGLERLSVIHAVKHLERADIAVLVVDAVDGPTEQDARIAGLAEESGKGIIMAVNKWDAIEKETRTFQDFEAFLRGKIQFVPYAPVLAISAKTGQRVTKVLDLAMEIAKGQSLRIGTGELNRLIDGAYRGMSPPKTSGNRPLKLFFATQITSKPPTIVIKVNEPKAVHFSYERYLINQIRAEYPYMGLPIRLLFRPRSRDEGRPIPRRKV